MITDIFSKPEVFWFVLGIIFFVFELVMPGFFIFFFGVGACATAIFCFFCPLCINLQIIIFLSVSVLSLLVFRKMLKKKIFYKGDDEAKSIEDEFTGKNAVAITDFDKNCMGKVEFKGTSWNAEANVPVKTGQIVKIIDKEGFKLKVELKNN